MFVIKILTLKGSHLMWYKSDFPYLRELLSKEKIRSLWEQILSFKRSSHFEKGRYCRDSLFDTVVPFDVRSFFQRSG